MNTKEITFTMTVNADTCDTALHKYLAACPHAHSVEAVSSAPCEGQKDAKELSPFTVGSIVHEADGDTEMTVSKVQPTEDGEIMVECQWFEAEELKEDWFKASDLLFARP